ncbi:EAL domain-containing protein [Undibacterium sp. Jales W-56]|uniref:putative bifunctional diguanylate cyclase/phosphodiesterase n=1 Tax=Undibacterium sp. Jales W-56 TaxID=2897325 RepID=UPI0021D305B1|nr:EAL domain-containing protein [Undibacterium sp. Jales W-56]MCU6434966.1 EAL domain-containing protein [Undibacterium sp. Jales W-56]
MTTEQLVKKTLEKKLLLVNLLAFSLASSFAVLLIVSYLWMTARSDLLRNAEIVAQVIAQNSAPALLFKDQKAAQEAVRALAQDTNVLAGELRYPDGSLFAVYQRPVNAGQAWQIGEVSQTPYLQTPGSHFYSRYLVVTTPVMAEEQQVGSLQMHVDLTSTYQRIAGLIAVIVLATLAAVLLAGRLLKRYLRRILNPIQQLVMLMQEVSGNDDYNQRALIPTDDEIGTLGESFNFMIEQIQRRDMAIGKELVERKRAEVQLDHIAHYDSVTGLPNRHFFNRRIKELEYRVKNFARFGLLFIDLDNFKYVNDTFGHRIGDLLLIAVADRLQKTLRSNDLVVRLGGDEFAVLLDNPKSTDDALRLAEKLLALLSQSFSCEAHEFNIGASIGVAMMPDHVGTFEDLLSSADAAMYEAKAFGKNNVQLWKPAMSRRTAQRFTIESGLRKAIENAELEVYYQPIMELATLRVAGMEALLRWKHPTLGFVSPAEFIPIAEESQLIVLIGEWVLQQACSQIKLWEQQFGPLFVAVNVSARQFRQPGFADSVERIVRENACPAHLLELELTETMLMSQTSETLAILTDLSSRGFKLSLDDFGTGYSSLAYLKRFPIHKLKIDRSFVSDLPGDKDDAAIAQAIISLSDHMDMRVVAEGIETREQAEFLYGLDCTYGQGFLFSKPLPAPQCQDFVEKNLRRALRERII